MKTRFASICFMLAWAVTAYGGLPIDIPPDGAPPEEVPGHGIFVPDAPRDADITNVEVRASIVAWRDGMPDTTLWKMAPRASVTAADSIALQGVEEMSGRFLRWADGTIHWELPAARQPALFRQPVGGILRLAPPAGAAGPAASRWTVRLRNGDMLIADGLTMDAAHLDLVTPGGGQLRLARALVAALYRDPVRLSGTFKSVQRLAEWNRVLPDKRNMGCTRYQWLYRDVGLPDNVAIDLPMILAGGQELDLYLFADGPGDIHNFPHYRVDIRGASVWVTRRGGSSVDNGTVLTLPEFGNGYQTDMSLRVNRKTGRVMVLVDGEVRLNRQLLPLPDDCGRGMWVVGRVPGAIYAGAVQSGWPLPERILLTPLAADKELAAADQDRVRFAGGDSVACALETIGAEKVVIASKSGRQELPLEKLTSAQLAAAGRTVWQPRDGDVTVELRGGGRLTGRLEELNEGRMVLNSEWGAKIAMPRAEVTEVRWGRITPTAPPSRTAWTPGTMELVDGQLLAGNLAGFGDDTVYWKMPVAVEPLAFRKEQVVRTVTTAPLLNADPAPAVVRFANGDRLSGEFASMDMKTIRFRPSGMATVSVERAAVSALWPGADAEGVLDTGGSRNWESAEEGTKLKRVFLGGGGFSKTIATAPSSRYSWQGQLPERLALQFTVARENRDGLMTVSVFNDGLNDPCRLTFYGLSMFFGRAEGLRRLNALFNDRNRSVERGQVMQLEDGDWRTVAITFLIDRKQGEFLLLADGRPIRKWGRPFQMIGNERREAQGMVSYPVGDIDKLRWEVQDVALHREMTAIKDGKILKFEESGTKQIRRIVVSEWRGGVDLFTNAPPAAVDRIWRHDMTQLAGSVIAIEDGWLLASDGTNGTNVPLGNVAWIDFPETDAKAAPLRSGDVRLYLPDGDQLTLTAARADKTGVTGTAAGIGLVTVPANTIARIDFLQPPATSNAVVAATIEPPPEVEPKRSLRQPATAEPKRLSVLQATEDSIIFRNGEEWLGKLLRSEAGTVYWESPFFRQPAQFRTEDLTALRLAPPPETVSTSAPPRWLVRLNNGNVLTGDALTMDAAQVEFTSTAVGRLRVRREMVMAVYQDTAPVDGSFRHFEWLPNWDRIDAKRVYRNVELPGNVSIEIPGLNVNPPPHIYLRLFSGAPSDSIGPQARERSIRIWGDLQGKPYVLLQEKSISHNDKEPDEKEIPLQPAKGRSWVDLAFRINLQAARMTMTVDGEVKKTGPALWVPYDAKTKEQTDWTFEEYAPQRNGITVWSLNPGRDLRHWMVLTPMGGDLPETAPAADQDRVQFINGLGKVGALEMIGTNMFVLNGATGRLEIPMERFVGASLAVARRKELPPRKGDVAVELRDGEQVTGILAEATDSQVVIDSEWGGKIALPRAAAGELRWGPDAPGSPSEWDGGQQIMAASLRQPGTVKLSNGQQVRGTLAGFTADTVFWKHSAAVEPLALRRDEVVRAMTLLPAISANPSPAAVWLTNGDRVSGEWLEMDEKTVRLKAQGMPPISVPRSLVARLRPGVEPVDVLETGGNTNWTGNKVATAGNGVTPFQEGVAYSRRMPLPDRLCVQFELAADEANRFMTARAFGKAGTYVAYQLLLNGGLAALQVVGDSKNGIWSRMDGFGGVRTVGDRATTLSEVPHFRVRSEQPAIEVTWLIDRARRETLLLIDGRVTLRSFLDSELPSGDTISFAAHNKGAGQLRRIVISEWRGSADLLAGEAPPGADSVILHDMTRLTGHLKEIGNGLVSLAVAGGETNLPLGRVSWIDCQQAGEMPAPVQRGDARVYLPDGDRLTLGSARCDKDGLTGTAAGIGRVTLPANAIVRVDFGPGGLTKEPEPDGVR